MKKIIFFLLNIFISTITIQKKNKKISRIKKFKKYNKKIFKKYIQPFNIITQPMPIEKLKEELATLEKEEIILKDKLNNMEILKKNIEKKISKEKNKLSIESNLMNVINEDNLKKEINDIAEEKINNTENQDENSDSDDENDKEE